MYEDNSELLAISKPAYHKPETWKVVILVGLSALLAGWLMRKKIKEVFDVAKAKEIIKKYAGQPILSIPFEFRPPAINKALSRLSNEAVRRLSTIPIDQLWGVTALYTLPTDTLRQTGTDVSSVASSAEQFVNMVKPRAIAKAKQYGYKDANEAGKWITAQIAHESGWGGKAIGGWNLGGHIATNSWIQDGGKYTLIPTWEDDGRGNKLQTIRPFRAFDTLDEFLDSHVKLITNSRYNTQSLDTIDQFAQRLKDKGYATDTAYVSKLRDMYNSVNKRW